MNETVEKAKSVGRPTDYTPELGEQILELHANGVSIKDICDTNLWAPLYPSTVMRWAENRPDFALALGRARKMCADALAEQTLAMLEKERDPQRARVAIQARQWLAGKLDSARFGDKVQLDVEHKVSLVDAIGAARSRVLPVCDQHVDHDDQVVDAQYTIVDASRDNKSSDEDLPDFFD